MAHIHELYDFTASAFIVFNNKILLIHHAKLNSWLQPGGHIELNETPTEALWREIAEETGLTKDSLTIVETAKSKVKQSGHDNRLALPFDINVHPYPWKSHKHIDMAYLLTSTTETVSLETGKAHDIRWLSISDLDDYKANKLLLEGTYESCRFALNYVAGIL